MDNVLELLWCEFICPKLERKRQREEVIELLSLLDKNEKNLNDRLNEEEKEIFVKYRECIDELAYYYGLDAFKSGVWLGSGVASFEFSED